MRVSYLAPALVATLTVSLTAAARAELGLGDPAPALKVSKWVKGAPVTLAKGKVHVVEFWATWCGPCRVSIPHLTELAKKYKSSASFTGVSINEGSSDYQTKVAKFVKDMGAKMDYSVAIDTAPQSGFMAKSWMEAAKQPGIPTAFIVDKAGKIAWIGHPMAMEEPLSKIVAGTWDMAAAKRMAQEERNRAAEQEKIGQKVQEFAGSLQQLLVEGKTDEALALADKEAATGPQMKAQVAQVLNQIAWTVAEGKQELPAEFAKLKDAVMPLAKKAVELTQEKDGMILDTLAFVYYKQGNVKEALALQEKAIKLLPADLPADMRKEMDERLSLYKSKQ